MGESPPGFPMKSIYFNHIPRTGGTAVSIMLYSSGIGLYGLKVFTQEIASYQKKEFNHTNLSKSDLIMGHYGIAPSIMNPDLDTITFLRNPVEQVVSMFSKLYKESQSQEINSIDFNLIRLSKFKDDPINLFREWLYDEKSKAYTNNGQISNLINTRYPYLYDIDTKEVVAKQTDITVTESNAKEKMESLLFVGVTENLHEGYIKIVDIINDRFNINLLKSNKIGRDNSISTTDDILGTLNKEEIDYILAKNSIDNYYWGLAKQDLGQ